MIYSQTEKVSLFHGNCLSILKELPPESVDVIFADPPYFLSNGGSTCKSGKRVSVNKGKWDKSMGLAENHAFNSQWLSMCQKLLKPNGTIWVSGTFHIIYSLGFSIQQLGYRILNNVTWEKPNPPPNLACRYFTHSTETLIWAAKNKKSKYFFDYALLKEENNNKQMKDVWKFTSPKKSEKTHGKHPTQKPLSLLRRVLRASAPENAVILDPFNGSGTTGVAARELDHSYIGIDENSEYLDLTLARINELSE